mgnify:FL=1
MNNKDYYKTLGLNKNATGDEIKKNYKILALKFHPDRNNGSDSRFKEIAEAYETLNDSEKKKLYDNPRPQFQMRNMSPLFNNEPDITNILNQISRMHMNNNIQRNTFSFNRPQKGTCKTCNGTGSITTIIQTPVLRMEQTATCNKCHGSKNS